MQRKSCWFNYSETEVQVEKKHWAGRGQTLARGTYVKGATPHTISASSSNSSIFPKIVYPKSASWLVFHLYRPKCETFYFTEMCESGSDFAKAIPGIFLIWSAFEKNQYGRERIQINGAGIGSFMLFMHAKNSWGWCLEASSTHSPDHMWYRHQERGKAGEPDQNWFTCECQKLQCQPHSWLVQIQRSSFGWCWPWICRRE